MGQVRKPTELLILSGATALHPERFVNRLNEPQMDEGVGNPSSYLSTQEKKIWREISKDVYWLKVSDRLSLEIVCRLTAKMRDNSENLKIMELQTLVTTIRSLGMTPADRSRINAPAKVKEDEWTSILSSEPRK